MKHYFQFVVLAGFLISGPFVSGEVLAADPAMTAAEMQAKINAQAFEIEQLKRERISLQLKVDQAWAIVQQKDKEGHEFKKIVANLEKELRDCRGTRR
ncbi:MAG: hypothetical protein AB1560_12695 [Pseudomonadota bacterium]